MSYEKALRQQKLRAEISQAKKIANHFAESVDKEERLKKNKGIPAPPAVINRSFAQRETQEEVESRNAVEEKREHFLKTLFA